MGKMNKQIKNTVRTLRKYSTNAEKKFWYTVRNRNIGGYKFLRQHPVKCTIDGHKRFFLQISIVQKRNLLLK